MPGVVQLDRRPSRPVAAVVVPGVAVAEEDPGQGAARRAVRVKIVLVVVRTVQAVVKLGGAEPRDGGDGELDRPGVAARSR